jgi:hypothetical protein
MEARAGLKRAALRTTQEPAARERPVEQVAQAEPVERVARAARGEYRQAAEQEAAAVQAACAPASRSDHADS